MNFQSLNQLTVKDIIKIIKGVDKKTWIKIGVGASVVALIFYFFIWPAWVERLTLRTKISSLKDQLSILETLNHQKEELSQKKEESLEFIYGAKKRIFKKGEASLLLGEISKLADQTQVAIISSSPKDYQGKFPAPFDAQYEASVYEFAVEGGYHHLGKFVEKVETNPKILRIEQFEVSPSDQDPLKHSASLRITAVSSKV